MTSAIMDIQKHVFGRLHSDAILIQQLGGDKIFDHVPERVESPYIVMGRCVSTDWSTSTEDGQALVFYLHIWSRSKGRSEIYALQERVKTLLQDHEVAAGNQSLVALRFQLSETRRDRTDGHLHGVMRFRAITEPNN